MNKKTIIITLIAIGVIFLIYQSVLKEKTPEYTLAEVVRGNVVQEVLETGQVQMGEEIDLVFKNSGIIERIYVRVGDKVEPGTLLAKLDTAQLSIELDEARASLEVAQAKLDKLLAGSTPEEIQVAQTSLANAKQNLKDVEAEAEEDLNQAYEDALNTLDGSYEKGSAALTTVTLIQKTYFTGNDQESITVRDKKNRISEALSGAKKYIDEAKLDPGGEKIERALFQLKTALSNTYNALSVIREMTESLNYKNTVSSSDKKNLDTEKSNVNTGLTNVINSQQTITSTKLTNEANINTAKGTVKKAEDELALKKAEPSRADLDLYQAQVRQAQAKVRLLENKIWEATLRSPTGGQVIKVDKKVGEMVQPVLAESAITLLPASPYEIKVDIYEEDVVKIDIGNLVEITLVAFPNQIFKGKVISINPAEKLIEGVVYYEVIVDFEEAPRGIKPGMTADLMIRTTSKENVLIIPGDAIQKKNGKNIVSIFKDNQIEEREIEIGLKGSDDMVEVISGLAEGENIIIK